MSHWCRHDHHTLHTPTYALRRSACCSGVSAFHSSVLMVPPAAAERGETGDAADAPDTKDLPESNIPLLSPPCEPWLMALSTLVTLPLACQRACQRCHS